MATDNTTTQAPSKADDAQAVQERFAALEKASREIGPQDDDYVTPEYMKRLASLIQISVPATLSVLPGPEGKGFRFTRYMTPEQEDAWTTACKGVKSIHVARAHAAHVLGFTPQDVDDLAFLASTKAASKARENLLAWAREYAKRYASGS
jgi:hypothetical protein